MQIKPHVIHFQAYEVTEMKEYHFKEPLYIFLYYVKEMSEFGKSVKLRRFGS